MASIKESGQGKENPYIGSAGTAIYVLAPVAFLGVGVD